MILKAYAKINMILNVLGTLPGGYHEVEMLMQAISLYDVVELSFDEPDAGTISKQPVGCEEDNEAGRYHILGPQDFKYGTSDLAYRAALLMAETFRPELICSAIDSDGLELAAGVRGACISIEKNIPAAAGLGGGSADAAAVMVGLATLWGIEGSAADTEDASDRLLRTLLPLGAELGSDVPFCIAAQLGRPAAIARGTGTELEFVEPVDCAVSLYFSDRTVPNKTAAVYRELKEEDCTPRYDIRAFLAAKTIEEKRSLMGNHLQAAAERLFESSPKGSAQLKQGANAAQPSHAAVQAQPEIRPVLCGAGPTCFTIGETGEFRTIT